MNKSIRPVAVVLVAGLSLAMVGCSSGGSDDGGEVSLGLGNVLSETHPWNVCGADAMVTSLEESGAGVSLEVYPAGQTQADTLEQLDALQSGTLDLTFAGPAQLATRSEVLNIFDAAYMFRDADHLLEVMNGEIGDEVFGDLADESGLNVLSTGYYGTRHVTANKPVTEPSDLDGMKLRVIDSPLWIDNAKAIGAEPTPVAFAELYLALQQGVVDAEENPLPTISSEKFFEVQDYVSLTAHNIGAESIVASQTALDKLSDSQVEALNEAAIAGAEAATKCIQDEEDDLLKEWSAEDSPIEVVTDVDLDAFSQAAEDYLLPKYGDQWGDLYDRIRNS
ncbi:DctP family TRAP transporter solute-binding subunit [Paramicrobacterium chengjingii]|uniref:DctP family TRAP transporter solute-binding subunit n=1 Tax=Paramicrobacterium chengjingii TaxID=2769067 RepID=A0ABX6YHQ1_9MICO|nr:DctP family TRAP transporter solute-binding subunit [Microbacterium chengjingii]QPZ38324.1 DctP family TRAP transporter solute-binding subunit [Microbacterium chengjingii]